MSSHELFDKEVKSFCRYFDWEENSEQAGELMAALVEAYEKGKLDERETLFRDPSPIFRGNRIKMTEEAKDTLLKSIDTTP